MNMLVQLPSVQRLQARAYRASEELVEDELKGLMTLTEAVEVKPLYSSSTLIALRDESPRLIQEGIIRAKGNRESAVYCIYVEEWPGLFGAKTPHSPNEQGVNTLRFALQAVREKHMEIIPIWTVSHNAAEAIVKAAKVLEVDTVIIGASRRSAFYHMLRGQCGKGADEETAARLPSAYLKLAFLRCSRNTDSTSTIPFRLHGKKLRVNAFGVQQLLMAAHLGNSAAVDNDDPVGHAHGGKTMGDQDRHFPLGELLKALKDFVFGLRIQRCRRLIQH